jgi:uncharacterized protein
MGETSMVPRSPIGSVERIGRYPVKSLRGEWCGSVSVISRGLEFDRAYALYGADGKIGSGKSTRRFRKMNNLLASRSWVGDQAVLVDIGDGETRTVGSPDLDAALSRLVGEDVTVRGEAETPHKDEAALHLVTTASLRWVQGLDDGFEGAAERFRPNLIIDVGVEGKPEDQWVGRTLRIGGCELHITKPTERCVMITQQQQDLPFRPGILSSLVTASEGNLGVYAEVMQPGVIRLGDLVSLDA